MRIASIPRLALAAFLASDVTHAALSITSNDDVRASAKLVAWDLLQYYKGNQSGQTPGILPGPPPAGDYYWWEGGALWGTMVDYWYLTGDDTYNDLTTQALLFQVGPDQDYMPPNVTASLGNDDQGFWGMSAMLAAERNFPNPPADQPQWLALAQAVFNTQANPDRHDSMCGGGLRWQIPLSNNGYDYKNSIANGIFFNLGARLARYTENQTYADWAERTWDWVRGVGLMDDQYNIYDGGHVEHNCTDINKAQFSYNNGVYLLGAAFMYNYTNGSDIWRSRTQALVDATISTFFPDDIIYEVACEPKMTCTTDMLSFKGYMHRWMATATQVAPFLQDQVLNTLKTSAAAGVSTCTGGANQRTCSYEWAKKAFDGSVGAGQEMNVLGALSALLIDTAKPPVTNSSGGTSAGNSNAGADSASFDGQLPPVSAGDKAGAAFLTLLILGSAVGTFGWMSSGA